MDFVIAAYDKHPGMNLEVFVHKADVLTEEYKIGTIFLSLHRFLFKYLRYTENFRHIQDRVLSELSYAGSEYEAIPISFQLTSIYDHSLHDAFSRVLHKSIDCLPYLEDLMNVFCAVRLCELLRCSVLTCPVELSSYQGVPLRHRVKTICRY